jgi:hypothetical protein
MSDMGMLRQYERVRLPMSRLIPIDKVRFWAQGGRHDVGSFFLASLIFPFVGSVPLSQV